MRAVGPFDGEHAVERVEPFLRFLRIGVAFLRIHVRPPPDSPAALECRRLRSRCPSTVEVTAILGGGRGAVSFSQALPSDGNDFHIHAGARNRSDSRRDAADCRAHQERRRGSRRSAPTSAANRIGPAMTPPKRDESGRARDRRGRRRRRPPRELRQLHAVPADRAWRRRARASGRMTHRPAGPEAPSATPQTQASTADDRQDPGGRAARDPRSRPRRCDQEQQPMSCK